MRQGYQKTAFTILAASIISTAVISCGDTPPGMMADAMVDAGELLMDGGRMLMDGGRELDAAADAMPPSDAAAQDDGGSGPGSCGTCNAGGALRTVTADTDPTRLEHGILDLTEGLVGPIVITDVAVTLSLHAGRGSVWIAPPGAACTGSGPGEFRLALEGDDGGDWSAHGARIFVPAGQRLCGMATDPAGSPTISWAGFRPY